MDLRLRPPELVSIPAGTWTIGCEDGLPDEAPVRRVTLPSFRAAVAPVTNAEYALFARATDAPPLPFADDPALAHPDQPAVGVGWHDAVAYLTWLSEQLGEPVRLPTEAEREVAARGGLEGKPWPWGDEDPDARPGLAGIAERDRPHVPGPECANPWGLRCMACNVHEWCSDWYGTAGRPGQPPRRASRGGSWRHRVKFTRVSARSSLPPDRRYADYGFRVFAGAEGETCG